MYSHKIIVLITCTRVELLCFSIFFILLQVIRPVILGAYRSLSNSGGYIRIEGKSRLTQSCTMHVIINIIGLVTGECIKS